MSVEDRVRAATRARTALVREIRPLRLPEEPPGRARRFRHPRGARTWAVPLAAAAAVAAVALTLVFVRQAAAPHPEPVPSGSSAGVPRYYAALTGAPTASDVTVSDDRTGKPVATVAPPAGQSFINVTAAADDRTFVVTSQVGQDQIDGGSVDVWYLLRVAPGTARPAQLTKLPIKPVGGAVGDVEFLAASLSPDASELAVVTAATSGLDVDVNTLKTTLRIYSVSAGAPLRTWTANRGVLEANGLEFVALSWLADGRHLAFDTSVYQHSTQTVEEALLDVTSPGGDLMAHSRIVFAMPQSPLDPCDALSLSPDGGTVICGTQSKAVPAAGCAARGPAFTAYSVSTGKPVRVLYRDRTDCGNRQLIPLWSDSGARHVIVVQADAPAATSPRFALVTGGRLVEFPPTEKPPVYYLAAF